MKLISSILLALVAILFWTGYADGQKKQTSVSLNDRLMMMWP
jgi:hypothetical protein